MLLDTCVKDVIVRKSLIYMEMLRLSQMAEVREHSVGTLILGDIFEKPIPFTQYYSRVIVRSEFKNYTTRLLLCRKSKVNIYVY